MEYDVIIIGGGPAGYTAAIEGARYKLNIALIEEKKIGGVCLHEGCIPMKSMLHEAKQFHEFKSKFRSEIFFDLEQMNREKQTCQQSLEKSLTNMLKSSYINLFWGMAEIQKQESTGKFQILLSDNQLIQGRNLIIASGSYPSMLSNVIADDFQNSSFLISSGDFIRNPFSDSHTLVVGAGAVGLELADYITMSGNRVTVIEKEATILPGIDKSIQNTYLTELKRKGILFETETQIEQVNSLNKTVVLKNGFSGKFKEVGFDRIIVATGRKAKLPAGLSEIGITYNSEGKIVTNYNCQTNVAGCYACGDVNDKSMLAHIAFEEGKCAILNIIGKDQSVRYESIPQIIYTTPEFAWVGLSPSSDNVKFQATSSMAYGSRYFIENRNEHGSISLYFNNSEVIVGAQIMGTGAAELIVFIESAIIKKMTMTDLKNFCYPHPSIAEAIKYIKLK